MSFGMSDKLGCRGLLCRKLQSSRTTNRKKKQNLYQLLHFKSNIQFKPNKKYIWVIHYIERYLISVLKAPKALYLSKKVLFSLSKENFEIEQSRWHLTSVLQAIVNKFIIGLFLIFLLSYLHNSIFLINLLSSVNPNCFVVVFIQVFVLCCCCCCCLYSYTLPKKRVEFKFCRNAHIYYFGYNKHIR